jgi:galactose mutarotase-like enzyme
MAPTPNRVEQGKAVVNGEEVDLNDIPEITNDGKGNLIHGPLRNMPWKVERVESGKDGVVIECSIDTTGTKVGEKLGNAEYRLIYTLKGNKLHKKVRITNKDDKPIDVGFGWHDWANAIDVNNWQAILPAGKYCENRLGTLLPTGNLKYASGLDIEPGKVISLEGKAGSFDNVLTDLKFDADGWATSLLYNKENGTLIRFRQDGKYLKYIVFFTHADGKSICVEAQSCMTNAHNLKVQGIDSGLVTIAPGETIEAESTLEMENIGPGLRLEELDVNELKKLKVFAKLTATPFHGGIHLEMALKNSHFSTIAGEIAGLELTGHMGAIDDYIGSFSGYIKSGDIGLKRKVMAFLNSEEFKESAITSAGKAKLGMLLIYENLIMEEAAGAISVGRRQRKYAQIDERIAAYNEAIKKIDAFGFSRGETIDLSKAADFIGNDIFLNPELYKNFVTHYVVDYLAAKIASLDLDKDNLYRKLAKNRFFRDMAIEMINKDLDIDIKNLFNLVQNNDVKKEMLISFIHDMEDYTNESVEIDDEWSFENTSKAIKFITKALDELDHVQFATTAISQLGSLKYAQIKLARPGEEEFRFLEAARKRFLKQMKDRAVADGARENQNVYRELLQLLDDVGRLRSRKSDIIELAKGYEKMVNKLINLKTIHEFEARYGKPEAKPMQEGDYDAEVVVEFPVGLSYSRCAWDNLGRVLRDPKHAVYYLLAAIKFLKNRKEVPAGRVTVKRLNEERLFLHAKSYDELGKPAIIDIALNEIKTEDFFNYSDTRYRLLKEVLVANGIVREHSDDVGGDIRRFVGKNGGLSILVDTILPGGTGLGTSGAVATALCAGLDSPAVSPNAWHWGHRAGVAISRKSIS